jgi:hypothetical protein
MVFKKREVFLNIGPVERENIRLAELLTWDENEKGAGRREDKNRVYNEGWWDTLHNVVIWFIAA